MAIDGFQCNDGTMVIANLARDYFISAGVEIRLSPDLGGSAPNMELDDVNECDWEGYERQVPATWDEPYLEDNIANVKAEFVEFVNNSAVSQFPLYWYMVDPAGAGTLLCFGLLDTLGPKTVPAGTTLTVRVNWRHSQFFT